MEIFSIDDHLALGKLVKRFRSVYLMDRKHQDVIKAMKALDAFKMEADNIVCRENPDLPDRIVNTCYYGKDQS